jgi:hypothetical protein
LVKLRWISKQFRYNRQEYEQTKNLNPEWRYWRIEDKDKGTLIKAVWV